MTVVNGGLITTGAITVGSPVTGGMAGDGNIRIWAGGSYGNATNAMFRVDSIGNVHSAANFTSRGVFYITDAGGNNSGGFSSSGTGDSPVRFWIGGGDPASPAARFRIYGGGSMHCPYLAVGDIGGSTSELSHLGLSIGNVSNTNLSRSVTIFGSFNYPPRFSLKQGTSDTDDLFRVYGQKYGTESFNRTMIFCNSIPLKNHIESWYGQFPANDVVALKYSISRKLVFAEL
jgi:hypothetical protein